MEVDSLKKGHPEKVAAFQMKKDHQSVMHVLPSHRLSMNAATQVEEFKLVLEAQLEAVGASRGSDQSSHRDINPKALLELRLFIDGPKLSNKSIPHLLVLPVRMDSFSSAQTIEDVEEGPQLGQSVSQASVRRRFSKQHDALQEKQESDTDNLNREIEAFEQSPNPSSVVETGVDGLRIIPTPPPAPAPKYHTFSIHILSLLMAFSVLGTLARLGIHALASYPGQSIFPLAWVQAVGCLVMGFTLGIREPLIKFYGPLFTGITTGFCGSLTTFSSWQEDVFAAWSNEGGLPKLWIYDIMDGLTRLVFTLAVSLSSFDLGLHLGRHLSPRLPVLPSPPTPLRWVITCVSIAVYVLTIPFFVRLNHAWRPLATTAIMFSFPGTLTRYILSTQLNPRINVFPIGTFLANQSATVILGICHILQRTPSFPSPVSCSILQGIIDGFCGCLSTVSSFVSEVRLLRSRNSWIYIAASVLCGQFLLSVSLGPAWWSGRIHENVLCSFT